jgi:hypothetical protein
MKNININCWQDIPARLLKHFLKHSDNPNIRLMLFTEILKHHKVKVNKEQYIKLFSIVDWSFLDYPPTYALVPFYRRVLANYTLPSEKLQSFSCLEFHLLNDYYAEFTTDGNSKNLFYVLLNIGHIKDQDQVEKSEPTKFPVWFQRSMIIYANANLNWFHKLYSQALEISSKRSTVDDGLGWTSTFLGVAESQVFGNIHEVYKSNIHDVMAFLIKKNREQQNELPAAY